MNSINICFIYMNNIDISDLAFSLSVPELPKMPEISNIIPEVSETIVESIPTAIEETIKTVIPESTINNNNNYMYIMLGVGFFAIICIYIYYKNFRNKNKKVTFQDNVNTPNQQPIRQQPMMQQPIRQQPMGQTYQPYYTDQKEK